MQGLSANFVSPALLGQTAEVSVAELANRANTAKTAQDFESSFLSIMSAGPTPSSGKCSTCKAWSS
jgi:hypothetical protein